MSKPIQEKNVKTSFKKNILALNSGDIPMALLSFFLPCGVAAQIAHRVRMSNCAQSLVPLFLLAVVAFIVLLYFVYPYGEMETFPTWSLTTMYLFGFKFLYGFWPFVVVSGIFAMILTCVRVSVRKRYRIIGNVPYDFVVSWLLTPCALVQMADEVELLPSFDVPDRLEHIV